MTKNCANFPDRTKMITDAARTQAETNMAAIKPVFGTTGYNIYFIIGMIWLLKQ